MLPHSYVCSSCGTKFHFQFREAWYYTGAGPAGSRVAYDDLLSVNVRPAWCKDCDCLSIVEDIASLPMYEGAYAAARRGRTVDYPTDTHDMDATAAIAELGDKLRWRMARRHPPRVLCCGGSRYQLMDMAQPLFKHAQCDFGIVAPELAYIGPFNGPGPGMRSPANIRLYDPEGELIGQLTWHKRDERMWEIEPLRYPRIVDDDE